MTVYYPAMINVAFGDEHFVCSVNMSFVLWNRRSEERSGSHGDTQRDRAAAPDGGPGQGAVRGSCAAQNRGRTVTYAHVCCALPHRALAGSSVTNTLCKTVACLQFPAWTIYPFWKIIYCLSNYKIVAMLLLLALQNPAKQRYLLCDAVAVWQLSVELLVYHCRTVTTLLLHCLQFTSLVNCMHSQIMRWLLTKLCKELKEWYFNSEHTSANLAV